MDLIVSQAEPTGPHIEVMGLSVIGIDTMGLSVELIDVAMAVTGLGTGMKGQGLRVTCVLTGQSSMLC